MTELTMPPDPSSATQESQSMTDHDHEWLWTGPEIEFENRHVYVRCNCASVDGTTSAIGPDQDNTVTGLPDRCDATRRLHYYIERLEAADGELVLDSPDPREDFQAWFDLSECVQRTLIEAFGQMDHASGPPETIELSPVLHATKYDVELGLRGDDIEAW